MEARKRRMKIIIMRKNDKDERVSQDEEVNTKRKVNQLNMTPGKHESLSVVSIKQYKE